MPNQKVKNSLKAKNIKLPQMKFFLKRQQMGLSCTYWLLLICKILKKFLGSIQSYQDVPFSGPKWPICHEQNFFGTNHYYYFHLPIGPFHCTKFKKKFLQQILSYEDAPFWAKNGPFAPNKFFFGKNY